MNRITIALCFAVGAIVTAPTQAETPQAAITTIEAFSTMPQIRSVSVSPDGDRVAIVRATNKNGDYVIEIRETKDLSKKPVLLGADKMKVDSVSWLNNKKIGVSFRQLLKARAHKRWVGNYAITDADGKGSWVIPLKDRARGFDIIDRLPNNEDEVLVETDINHNFIPDVIRYNITTNKYKTVLRGNTKQQGSFIPDADGEIRAATGWNPADTAIDLYARKKGSSSWELVKQNTPFEREEFGFLGFSKENPNEAYVIANRGEDKAGLYIYDLNKKKYSERIFGLKTVDVESISQNPYTHELNSISYTSKHPKKYFLNPNEEALYQSIRSLFKGQYVDILSRSKNDDALVIMSMGDSDSGTYYLITDKSKLQKIGERLPLVDKTKLG